MIFHGAFRCEKCGEEFTIDLGPQKMGELKSVKKIVEFVATLLPMFAKSCREHETDGSCP